MVSGALECLEAAISVVPLWNNLRHTDITSLIDYAAIWLEAYLQVQSHVSAILRHIIAFLVLIRWRHLWCFSH